MDKNVIDTEITSHSLRSSVTEIMQQYFANLKGEEPRNVYDFFLDEIEEPLLVAVMKFTRDNQSEAARILGVSRGTLRSMLKKFDML
jgi:Fis family transcriptional regulator